MRRFITLTTLAALSLFAVPALAAPGGGPGHRATPAQSARVTPPPANARLAPVHRAARPAPTIDRATLNRAKLLQVKYTRDRAALLRTLRAERVKLERLERARVAPRVKRAQVRRAELKVSALERRLATLDARFDRDLARLLTPGQLRVFKSLS